MLTASTAFNTMINSAEQTVAAAITITLPTGTVAGLYGAGTFGSGAYGGGFYTGAAGVPFDVTLEATSIQITASTTTDLPDQARMQTGWPDIKAEFTLVGLFDQSDETKTAAWYFRRYSTLSPLYRQDALMCPVTIDVGLYPDGANGVPELVRKFTGYIDAYSAALDGSVTFTCVDRHALLRSLPAIPAVVTLSPYNDHLTAEYAVDAVLRAATTDPSFPSISSWPMQRSLCVLAVGGRSCPTPELGSIDLNAANTGFSSAPGKFGTAILLTNGWLFFLLSKSVRAADPVTVECWLQAGVTVAARVADYNNIAQPQVTVLFSGANVQVTVTDGLTSDTWTRAVTGGGDGLPHYVQATVVWSGTGWTGQIRFDATTYTTTRAGAPARPTQTFAYGALSGSGTVEAIQITTEPTPTTNYPFAPLAVLTASMNSLTVVPPVDAGDASDVQQQIAEAELAVAGFDESGVFRFWNRASIVGRAPAATVTSATSLLSVEEETPAASVINHAQVGFTSWTTGQLGTVWTLTGVWRAPAGQSTVFYATTDTPVTNVDLHPTLLPDNGIGTVGQSYYRVSVDKAGTEKHPGITVAVAQISSTKLRITLTNKSTRDAYLVASANNTAPPASTPVFTIGGTPVTAATETTADYALGTATSRFGEVLWQLTGSAWIQDGDSALKLATDVVRDSYVPRPNLTNIAIQPNPLLQLMDVLHLQDPDVTGVDEYGRIFGWELSLSGEDWAMTVDIRSLAPPGAWILGVPGRSELASTTYLQGV